MTQSLVFRPFGRLSSSRIHNEFRVGSRLFVVDAHQRQIIPLKHPSPVMLSYPIWLHKGKTRRSSRRQPTTTQQSPQPALPFAFLLGLPLAHAYITGSTNGPFDEKQRLLLFIAFGYSLKYRATMLSYYAGVGSFTSYNAYQTMFYENAPLLDSPLCAFSCLSTILWPLWARKIEVVPFTFP